MRDATIDLFHSMKEEVGDTLEDFALQGGEGGSIQERYSRLRDQIDRGEITDPSALDTYLQLTAQYFQAEKQRLTASGVPLDHLRVFDEAAAEVSAYRD